MTPLIVLVIGGGAERFGCPDAESPLARAVTPHLDRLAGEGRVFSVALSKDVIEAQGAAPILSMFGIDPAPHAVSRASLLAVGKQTPLQSGECYVSADFVSLFRDTLADSEPGPFRSSELEVLFQESAAALQKGPFRLLPGEGSNHYAIVQRALVDARVQGPEACLGREIASSGPETDAHALAHRVTRGILDRHEVNRVRRDLGQNGADMLWFWGPGDETSLPVSDEVLSVVTADPWWAGAARAAGMRLREPENATPEGAVAAVAQSLADGDAVCYLHVRGATAAALQKDLRARAQALADIDDRLVRPLAELTASRQGRLLVSSDTARETATGHPLADPVPALLWGVGVAAVAAHPFTDKGAFEAGRALEPGHGVVAYVRNL